MKSKIAVIIPVFNSEKYLEDCLRSVTDQTLKEIEVFCIDDGSIDNTASIISEFSNKDVRVKHILTEHYGPGHARNVGIAASNSEFIIFMDSDDIYPNDAVLEKLYNSALENDVQICGGSWSELVENDIITSFSDTGYVFRENGSVDYKDYQFDHGYHRFIYSSDMIKKNNITFPDYLRYQDPPFFVNAMVCANRFYALREPTYCRRVKEEDPFDNPRKITDLFLGLRNVFEFAEEHDLKDLRARTANRIEEHIPAITRRVMVSGFEGIADLFLELCSDVNGRTGHEFPSFLMMLISDRIAGKRTFGNYIKLWKRGGCRLAPNIKTIYVIYDVKSDKGVRWYIRLFFSSLRKLINEK